MFIQTEETPNPQSLKFLPGCTVMGEAEPVSFVQGDLIDKSPFSKKLLEIEGIEGVFLGTDFVTITKNPDAEWLVLKPAVLETLMELFVNNFPIILCTMDDGVSVSDDKEDPIIRQIKELLDSRIRPAVAQDGGDILFDSFQEGTVYLKMQGACSGCPSSTATLKSGIENMLKYYVPEVTEVRQVGN